jgi:hypothetical protein
MLNWRCAWAKTLKQSFLAARIMEKGILPVLVGSFISPFVLRFVGKPLTAICYKNCWSGTGDEKMRLETSAWSNSQERPERWHCPSCGVGLPAEALAGGQRLARCRQCGQMLRRVVTRLWPTQSAAFDAASTTPDWNRGLPEPAPQEHLEPAPVYPYPALQCPYCEHINQDVPAIRLNGQQYCANCGADLKKKCLRCDEPMYVLDYYCMRCRSDQEQLKYELEALYWQHYNEGKRLARLGRWLDAERELSLFFNPRREFDPEDVRLARQIYASSIRPSDDGEGLQLYNEAVEHLRRSYEARQRSLRRRKYARWGAVGGGILLLGIFSAITFGSWWAIFVIVPFAGLLVVMLIFILLSILGLN